MVRAPPPPPARCGSSFLPPRRIAVSSTCRSRALIRGGGGTADSLSRLHRGLRRRRASPLTHLRAVDPIWPEKTKNCRNFQENKDFLLMSVGQKSTWRTWDRRHRSGEQRKNTHNATARFSVCFFVFRTWRFGSYRLRLKKLFDFVNLWVVSSRAPPK